MRRVSSRRSPIRRHRTTASARPWRNTPDESTRVDRVRRAHHQAAWKTTRQGGQDVRRRIARVFVCTVGETDAVLGFYTLSALSVDLASLPEQLSRKLPRHPVPCALIGRLAVDRSAHGRGLGRMLLADAVKRTVAAGETVAMHAMVVDSANDEAKRFYERFGFVPLTDDPMRLFIPLGHAALQGLKGQAQRTRI